jgi:hypothetical protein
MPIYDQGYRRHVARSPLSRLRFWPITREALRLLLAKRAFLFLLLVAFVPLVARVIHVYVVTRNPQFDRILPTDGRMFGEFLNLQLWFAFLLAVFGASGLVANDLRSGGILVYLSRPLTQRDYIAGKLGVPLALTLAVTLVPGLALYGVGLLLAPEYYLKAELAWIAPAIVAQSLAMSLVVSLVVLAVSSLSRSARVAGLGFVALFLGLEAVRGVLQVAFDRREAVLLSLKADLQSLAASLFGLADERLAIHWAWPALVLAAVSLGCLLVLRSRVRAVEVVS